MYVLQIITLRLIALINKCVSTFLIIPTNSQSQAHSARKVRKKPRSQICPGLHLPNWEREEIARRRRIVDTVVTIVVRVGARGWSVRQSASESDPSLVVDAIGMKCCLSRGEKEESVYGSEFRLPVLSSPSFFSWRNLREILITILTQASPYTKLPRKLAPLQPQRLLSS